MHQRMSKSVLILLLVCIFHVYAQRWYYTGKFENEQVERHLFLGDILHYDRLFNSQTVGQTFLYSGGLVIKAAQYSSDEIVLGDSDNAFIRSVCDQHSMPGSSIQDIHIQSRMLYNIIISHNYSPKINESSGSVYHALLEAEIGLFNGKSFLEKKMLEVSSGNLTAIIVKGTYLSNSIEVEVDMSGKPLELAMYVVEHKIVYTSDFFGRVALVMHTWNHVSPPSPPISSKPNLASSTDQAGQGRKVRLMSYNLWHNNPPDWVYHDRKARWQRYAQRLQHFADIIVEHDPDIVMLQEVRMDSSFFNAQANLTYWTKADQTKADAGSQVEHLLHHLEASREALQLPAVDYHVVFQPAMLMFDRAKMVFRNEEGVMILSKLPLFDIQTVFLPRDIGNPSDDHQRVLLVAKAKVGDNVVEVATSHFSLLPEARMRGVDMILEYYAKNTVDSTTATDQCVVQALMGDFNAEPHEESIGILVDDNGDDIDMFVDSWTMTNPEDTGFTFPSCDPIKRIDYILLKAYPDNDRCKNRVTVESTQIVGIKPTKDTEHLVGSRDGLGMNDLDSPIWASDHFAIMTDIAMLDA